MKADRGLAFGARCGLSFAIVLVLSLYLSVHVRNSFPALDPLVLAAILSFAVVALAAQKRGLLAASIVGLAVIPVLAPLAWTFIRIPIDVPRREFPIGVTSVIVALALGSMCAGFLAMMLSRSRSLPIVRFAFHVLALAALGVSIVVVGFSIRKAHRASIDASSVYGHIEPIPGWLPALSTNPESLHFLHGSANLPPGIVHDDLHIVHRADFARNECEIVVESTAPGGARGTLPLPRPIVFNERGVETSVCPGVHVSRIADIGVWLLQQDMRAPPRDTVVVGPPFPTRGVRLESFVGDLAPPQNWIALALFGVAFAFGIAFTTRADRPLEAALGWTEVDQGGITILRNPAANRGLYRGSLDPSDHANMIVGSRLDLFERLCRRKATRWSLVFTVVSITATPLIVAAYRVIGWR